MENANYFLKSVLGPRYFALSQSSLQISPDRRKRLDDFHAFAKEHFHKMPMQCFCGSEKGTIISNVDRVGYEFPLRLCAECGLVYAAAYWDLPSIERFYSEWYRKCYSEDGEEKPKALFASQFAKGENVYNLIQKVLLAKGIQVGRRVADIGGGAGGVIARFPSEKFERHLFDFNLDYLKQAGEHGIETHNGGIVNAKQSGRFDLVILSHVVEHVVNLKEQLLDLRNALNDKAVVYIEVPGLDSLKYGRRNYNFLDDIQDAHVFYFTRQTLTSVLNQCGFEMLYVDREIRALCRKSEHFLPAQRHVADTKRQLLAAEGMFKLNAHLGTVLKKILPASIKNKARSLISR